jgi:hypothetical protein
VNGQLQKREAIMKDITLNIFGPDEIVRLKAVLHEVVLALPEQHRSCEMQASVAEQLLKLAAGGEKDPIRLKRAHPADFAHPLGHST